MSKPRRVRLKPVPDMLYRFATSKAKLTSLPEDARCTLLLCGHIVNEINTLHRLTLFSTHSWGNPVLDAYGGCQSWTVVRLWIGKVAEGLDVFQQRILGKPFGRTYLPLVTKRHAGKLAVTKLKKIIGGAGLLRRLRNDHTFHNPSDANLSTAFAKLTEAEDWSMMMAHERHTMYFAMSNVVAMTALLDATGKRTRKAAMYAIRNQVLDAANAFTAFFEQLLIALSENGTLFDPVQPMMDTSQLPSAPEVRIPPLCRATPPSGLPASPNVIRENERASRDSQLGRSALRGPEAERLPLRRRP